MTITGRRTPDEERAFKRACAEQLLHVGPAKERVYDPYTEKELYVTPTTQTCLEPTCIDGWIYHADYGLIPCPLCGGGICPKCHDTGMFVPERHVDDPDFGTPVLCPRPGCKAAARLQQERTAKLYAGAKLPRGYEGCTLASFQAAVTARPELSLWQGKMLAYYAIEAFIAAASDSAHPYGVDYADCVAKARKGDASDAYPDVRNSLVLYGPHGVGKTGMVAAVVNALVPVGHVVRYIRTQDFIKAVQDRYGHDWRDNPPDDEFGDLESGAVIDVVRKAPLLILDEFDMPDAATAAKQSVMENVIRHRTGSLLPTLVTTNLDADGLEERWGTTTLSVLKERAHFISMGGPVLRAVPQVVNEVL